jgi:hypothetical protein
MCEYLTATAIKAKKQESLVAVDECAVLPDLVLGPGLYLDLAHLHHGSREDLEEELGWSVDGVEDVGLGASGHDECGSRLEHAATPEHVAVVAHVEGPEAGRVHLHDRRVVCRRIQKQWRRCGDDGDEDMCCSDGIACWR